MALNFPEGTQDYPARILQSDFRYLSQTYSTNSTSWTAVANFTNNITTTAANSKILIIFNMGAVTGNGNTHAIRVTRDSSTQVALGDASGSRERHAFRWGGQNAIVNSNHAMGTTFVAEDSPSAAAGTTLVYGLQCRSEGGPMYINRSYQDANNGDVYNGRACSSILLLEVAP